MCSLCITVIILSMTLLYSAFQNIVAYLSGPISYIGMQIK